MKTLRMIALLALISLAGPASAAVSSSFVSIRSGSSYYPWHPHCYRVGYYYEPRVILPPPPIFIPAPVVVYPGWHRGYYEHRHCHHGYYGRRW
jgi:hypothetical protein